ncbi:MAG: hypothetical protein V5A42_00035, partial [Halofilum sp. (in: g-proteobacteria)]
MNCEEFRSRWSDWHDGREGVDDERMAGHRRVCPDCARHDREMRALLDGLATLPLPGQRPARDAWATPRW